MSNFQTVFLILSFIKQILAETVPPNTFKIHQNWQMDDAWQKDHRVNTLKDCESLCFNKKEFICKSFTYMKKGTDGLCSLHKVIEGQQTLYWDADYTQYYYGERIDSKTPVAKFKFTKGIGIAKEDL